MGRGKLAPRQLGDVWENGSGWRVQVTLAPFGFLSGPTRVTKQEAKADLFAARRCSTREDMRDFLLSLKETKDQKGNRDEVATATDFKCFANHSAPQGHTTLHSVMHASSLSSFLENRSEMHDSTGQSLTGTGEDYDMLGESELRKAAANANIGKQCRRANRTWKRNPEIRALLRAHKGPSIPLACGVKRLHGETMVKSSPVCPGLRHLHIELSGELEPSGQKKDDQPLAGQEGGLGPTGHALQGSSSKFAKRLKQRAR